MGLQANKSQVLKWQLPDPIPRHLAQAPLFLLQPLEDPRDRSQKVKVQDSHLEVKSL